MGQIENIALLILSLGLGLSSTLMSNRFMKRHLPSGVDCLRLNALNSLSSVVVLMIVVQRIAELFDMVKTLFEF